MPTKKPRVSIPFEDAIASKLVALAKQEGKSIFRVAKELVLEALELREDMALSAIAEARDVKKTKTIAHEDAWKE